MGSEWALVSIEDLRADSKGAIAIGPFGSRMKSDCYVEAGVPVIRGTNISDGPSFKSDFVFITEEMANTLGSCNVFEGDLVFPHRGSIGEVGIVPSGKRYVISSSLMKLTCNQDIADSAYLYYFFKSAKGRHELLKNASQVGTPGIGQPLTSLKSITLPLPPIAEQKSISSFLKTLDDKIEFNRQMNTTLEAMAQALFKSWFVDFDPVIDNALAAGNPIPDELAARAERRAKAAKQQSSEQPHTLFTAIRQQFPDRFVFTETMGWVPEGWEVSTVGEQVDTTGGGTPSTKENAFWENGRHPFCTPKDMSRLSSWVLLDTERHLTDSGINKVSSGLLPAGAVLMSSRAPIGYLAINDIAVAVNQGVIAMLPNSTFGPLFLLSWAKSSMEKIIDRANGSTFLEISKKNFRPIPFLVPDRAVAHRFNEESKAIYNKILLLAEEIENLTKLRDTLLPKLLSGQLRIPEAEQMLAEAL